jgi:hypothetical protein
MTMVCPQCGKGYEQRLQCQSCGVRLLYRGPGHNRRGASGGVRWRQTPLGRLIIGLALSQGLFYGLQKLLTGALMALEGNGGPDPTWWATPAGLLLRQAVCLVTLLLGTVLAGGGQRHGFLLGAVIGMGNSALTLLLQTDPAHPASRMDLVAQPLLQTVFGALGGWIGCAFWQPVPVLSPDDNRVAKKKASPRRRPLFAGPIAWVRVGLGILLAVAGTVSAGALFDFVLDASKGTLATTDELQDRVVTWEIKALALLLGGALAGATTPNGLKQGLAVAGGTAVILLGIYLNQTHWLELAGLTLVSSFTLTIVGGWFGSQLFPPVVKFRRSRDLGPAA